MSAVLFFIGFLAAGIVGVKTVGSFEIEPAERIGAEAFLFLLCVGASAISILSYLTASRTLHRYPGGVAGLVGGVVAAGTVFAAAGTGYLGADFALRVIFALVLPGLVAFVWPLLTAKARND